jgi:hypothetical protein
MMESISILQLHEDPGGGGDYQHNLQGSGAHLLAYSSISPRRGVKNDDKVSDVRAVLAQKDKDLILAAELGKELLEKNEEIKEQHQKMMEEFQSRLEVRTLHSFDNM